MQNPSQNKSEINNSLTKGSTKPDAVGNMTSGTPDKDIQKNQTGYTNIFKKSVDRIGLRNPRKTKEGETVRVTYVGNFSNKSRTKSEISYISVIFAGVLNRSYYSPYKWNVSGLNITGKNPNGSVIWDFRVEDWWAMNYIKYHWDIDDYINTVLNSGDRWNLKTGEPNNNASEYLRSLESRLENKTSAEVNSFEDNGAESFLTYKTDHELNSSQYFDQVANVVDVYKNLTLPRRFNRTDGWYAGVLNIEVRNGNDTLEWYRYQIRWAEARVEGEMSRQEEAYRLRQSRFLEKDRLRDEPATGE